jgi:hypothetical protein
MLTVAELRQAARDAAGPQGKVEDRTRQVEAELEVAVSLARSDGDRAGGVVQRAMTTVDEPVLSVRFGKIEVVFTVDRLYPARPRWVAAGPDGARSAVHGAGDVERAVSAAREAAGIPDHRRPVPSKLTFGGGSR